MSVPPVYSQTLARPLLLPGNVLSVAPVAGKTFLVKYITWTVDPQLPGASCNVKLYLDTTYVVNRYVVTDNPYTQQEGLDAHITVGSAQLLTMDNSDSILMNVHWIIGGYVLEGDPPLGPGPP